MKVNKARLDKLTEEINALIEILPARKGIKGVSDYSTVNRLISSELHRLKYDTSTVEPLTPARLEEALRNAILTSAQRLNSDDNASIKELQKFTKNRGIDLNIKDIIIKRENQKASAAPEPEPLTPVQIKIDEIIKAINDKKVGGTVYNNAKDNVEIQVKKELLTGLEKLKNQQPAPSAEQVTTLLKNKATFLNERGCMKSTITNEIRTQHNSFVNSLNLNTGLLIPEVASTSSTSSFFAKEEPTKVEKRAIKTTEFINSVTEQLNTVAETMGLREGSPERGVFNNFLEDLQKVSKNPDAGIDDYSAVIHQYEPQMEKLAPGIMNWVKNKVNEVCGTKFSVEKEGFSQKEVFTSYKKDMEISEPDSDEDGFRPS